MLEYGGEIRDDEGQGGDKRKPAEVEKREKKFGTLPLHRDHNAEIHDDELLSLLFFSSSIHKRKFP